MLLILFAVMIIFMLIIIVGSRSIIDRSMRTYGTIGVERSIDTTELFAAAERESIGIAA
jgi:uncharacterized membrane protein